MAKKQPDPKDTLKEAVERFRRLVEELQKEVKELKEFGEEQVQRLEEQE